ncbi:hypothetical protein ABT247_23725 [Kitasatospora sp. NPDC001539]|uniref:hypothetical protein n=1 Tax=Kitasatospora sp. NPDC001539 TaxID=3154384 RepID=UPI00333333DC
MGELEDLRARLTALEAEVDRLREESAAARAAATGRTATGRTTAGERTIATGRATSAAAERPDAGTTDTAGARTDRDGTEDRAVVPVRTRAPEGGHGDRVERPQSMTSLADVVGVMVSGQNEQTRVLRAHARTLEAQSSTLAKHGQFLESLLAGQEALQEELRR